MKTSISPLLASVWILFMPGTAPAVEDASAPAATAAYTPGGDWPVYNGTLDGQRYSPLAQINLQNAGQLAEVCRLPIAELGSFQSGLIVVGDTMYATTDTDTIALDAATCAVKWRYVYHRHQTTLYPVNRGAAYANGRLFRGTDDARLIALDAHTGAELWTDVVGDARRGELISGAPIAWNGLVFTGTAVGDFGVRGRVIAVDAATGREIWQFYTVPTGSDTGADTWINTRWNAHGGGGTWSSFAIDASSGELFVPVGNPVPDFSPSDRPGLNLFTDCLVVLDALNGRLRWWYQTKTNDSQDLDLGAAPLLYVNGDGDERVAVAGKDGYLHILDRDTHKQIVKTAVTTVDEKQNAPSRAGTKMCPGVAGGVEWNGPGFDPDHQLLFVGAVDYCTIIKSEPGSKFARGSVNNGGSWSPSTEPATGWISAIDANTGKMRWQYHAESPVVSGITPTAGGIVLGGDSAGNFLVFNSLTGAVLKKVATGGALAGGVITYEQRGKQYIAFASGNISRSVWGAPGRPSIVVMALPAAPKD
jgi:alcohol dehydrogenase (cytochrome c)